MKPYQLFSTPLPNVSFAMVVVKAALSYGYPMILNPYLDKGMLVANIYCSSDAEYTVIKEKLQSEIKAWWML